MVYAEFVSERWPIRERFQELKNHHGNNFMTDPITDMLNRIRNAQAVLHPTVDVPFSKMKLEIAKLLEREGFAGKVETKGRAPQKVVKINLKYKEEKDSKEKTPAISGMKRVSKPGQRIYTDSKKIKLVRGGLGVAVISTSKGLMTGKQVKQQKVGGEILFEIW